MQRKITVKGILIILLGFLMFITGGILLRGPQPFRPGPSSSPSETSTPAETPDTTEEPEPSTPAETPDSTEDPEPAVPAAGLNIEYEHVDYAPAPVDNNTDFVSGWSVMTTDANVNGSEYFEGTTLQVDHPGTSIDSLTYYRDGIPLPANTDYYIYFEAYSTIDRNIRVSLMNADTWQTLTSVDYRLTGEKTGYELTYTSNGAALWNGRLEFDLGFDGSVNDPHTIQITQLRIVPSNTQNVVKVNQIGYMIKAQKRCTFPYDAGDLFDVIDVQTGKSVYAGAIKQKLDNPHTGEVNCYGDFTNVTTPGTYYIRSQIGVTSQPFVISPMPYGNLLNDALMVLSLQRCGTSLDSSWAGQFAHGICHTSEAQVYGLETVKDVSGGWHDAGDYGRYMKTGAKAVSDLLFSYMFAPHLFGDSQGPDAGNWAPDILDEARYELEWMLKMQAEDGGVYNTVMTQQFPDIIDPADDHMPLILLLEETTSTADFAGAAALASYVYKDWDADFSRRCLEAAEKAWKYLSEHPDVINYNNPEGYSGGVYLDDEDKDCRFYAAISLWNATQKEEYLKKAKELFAEDRTYSEGLSWTNVGCYGKYLYLTSTNGEETDPGFYRNLHDALLYEANQLMTFVHSSGYQTAISNYAWGSNAEIANHGIILTMAYDFSGNQEYQQAAVEQLNYLLGKNVMNKSYITGYGTDYPKNIHSRLAESHNAAMTGALVGGPDTYHEDPVTADIPLDTPPAKNYADHPRSYSTNEISVNWNSALIHLLARLL